MESMLHIADIKKYERCPRSFWLSRREKKAFVPFVNYNESMKDLCKELLMIQDEDVFEGNVGDDGDLALAALTTHKVLINARFVYEDMRVKVPFLVQEDGKRIIYFTFRSCYPKEAEAKGMADTLQILRYIGIQVDEVYAIHLNHDYVRQKELDVRELLVISDHLYNAKNKPQKSIADLLREYTRDLQDLIADLHACEAMADVAAKRSQICTRGNKCVYFQDCFPPLNDTSILNLVQAGKKYEMLEDGIEDIRDVDVDRIEGTRHQYAQIMAAKGNGQYVDKGALRCWMKDHIQYPLSYLDFEWETFAFPPYQGMKPFDVLAFQYSLHVEEQPHSELTHTGYIGCGDCREEFVQNLIASIPKTGTILVYNMEGAEKLRLVQLSQQFPKYEKELRQIWERMVDLSLPFSTGNIYDVRMQGFYSLKTLVPIFSDYTYQDLDITYGIDAVAKWRQYCEADQEERASLYEQLNAYCSMDTYAEYIVFHAIEELITSE